jgi:hypothetical protein
MILPDLVLPSRINQHWEFSGMDHINDCLNKQHFLSYPYDISYIHNSRGFRDQEWPNDMQELREAIWCVGDSFTVGLGSPIDHTWPFRLSRLTSRRVINVSMDGASNEWIARITENIVQAINPKKLVIMWSYIHRRENPDPLLNDELRRIHNSCVFFQRIDNSNSNEDDDWTNFLDCKKRVDSVTNSVQFAIPFFRPVYRLSIVNDWASIRGSNWPVNAPSTVEEMNSLPVWILHELKYLHGVFDKLRNKLKKHQLQSLLPTTVTLVESQDLARDGHHFDLITAEWVATQAKCLLGQISNSKI